MSFKKKKKQITVSKAVFQHLTIFVQYFHSIYLFVHIWNFGIKIHITFYIFCTNLYMWQNFVKGWQDITSIKTVFRSVQGSLIFLSFHFMKADLEQYNSSCQCNYSEISAYATTLTAAAATTAATTTTKINVSCNWHYYCKILYFYWCTGNYLTLYYK